MWNTGGELNPPLLRGLQRQPLTKHTHTHPWGWWVEASLGRSLRRGSAQQQLILGLHSEPLLTSSAKSPAGWNIKVWNLITWSHITSGGFWFINAPTATSYPSLDHWWNMYGWRTITGCQRGGCRNCGVGSGWAREGGHERGLHQALIWKVVMGHLTLWKWTCGAEQRGGSSKWRKTQKKLLGEKNPINEAPFLKLKLNIDSGFFSAHIILSHLL